MKSSKARKPRRPVSAAAAVAVAPSPQHRWWPYAVGLLVALFAVIEVYWPSIRGPFLLDDTYLPYMRPSFAQASLRSWLMAMRPLLNLTYWLNYQYAGNQDTFGYHLVNVFLHFCNGVFIWLAVRKILAWAGAEKRNSEVLSIFAAGLFLLHPLQTESVSYVASRSETLSVFWVLAALVVFLQRRGDALSIPRIIAVLALFGAAVLSKEHTAVLPALFLLTDYYWNPGFSFAGIRRNWRLYLPIAAGGALALRFVWRVISASNTAGFHVKDFTWYQYFFTQCRAIWGYIGMFLLPVGQNVDPNFAISKTILDHGAVVGLLGLIAVTALAWIYRRRFPVASYGWFTFLFLIAPTSSIVPIVDPFFERRVYLPFIGLLLIAVDFLGRWKISKNALIATLSAVLLAESALTYQRNQLWGNAIDLWKDSVSKSPNFLRPRFQLASAYFQAGNCSNAVDEFQKADRLEPGRFDLLLDWALAYDCAGQPDEALAKLKQAAAIQKSAHVYSQIGMQYGKMGKYPEALEALQTAVQLDPSFAMTYYYLGNVHSIQGDRAKAGEEYRHVLALDPQNQPARDALARLGQ